MAEIATEHAFTLTAAVATPRIIGNTFGPTRMVVDVTGGSVAGPLFNGKVLPGGGDWIQIRPDGTFELDVRITLEARDGALVYMTYRGFRHGPKDVIDRLAAGERVDPSQYYFRAAPFFETGDERYTWMTKSVFVATGERRPDGPVYEVFRVL
jgi:hypothetical protein